MAAYDDCSQSLLTPIKTSCCNWLNCILCRYCTGSLHRTKCYVYSTMWKNPIICGPFYGFKRKRLFKMHLMHGNPDNISRVPILTWPGMTSSLTPNGSLNDTTDDVFLTFVSCAIIWYKNVPLQMSMENFKGEPIQMKFDLYFNQCVLQEDSTTENISLDISWCQFYTKKCFHIWYIKWCKY